MTTYGSWTEDSVATSASTLGLPDVVYRAKIVRKGAASREIGDVLLWGSFWTRSHRHLHAGPGDVSTN